MPVRTTVAVTPMPLVPLMLSASCCSVTSPLIVTSTPPIVSVPLLATTVVLASGLTEVVAVTAFIIALAKVPLGDITAIYQVAPLVVLVGASFMWGEHVGVLRWILIALGLARYGFKEGIAPIFEGVFGAATSADAVRTVVDRIARFNGQHGTVRRRDTPRAGERS